jgi:CheY-like chemotaxis protein
MSRPLVLCIDDDEDSLKVRELLLKNMGYDTLLAPDGDRGLALFTQRAVDIVIVDYAMPGLNGAEVARAIRAMRPEVPIVMLSGQPVKPDGVDSEVDSFVTKGRDTGDLLEELEQLLSKKKLRTQYESGESRRLA